MIIWKVYPFKSDMISFEFDVLTVSALYPRRESRREKTRRSNTSNDWNCMKDFSNMTNGVSIGMIWTVQYHFVKSAWENTTPLNLEPE